jgi:hypothetical protein
MDPSRAETPRRNPGELKLELFCRGLRIEPGALSDEAGRPIVRTRAGLGSGLELIIPGDLKDLWVNAPVVEAFARRSPLVLRRGATGFFIEDERNGAVYPVILPPAPRWYEARTSTGKRMMDIGVLQGTYLAIYVGPPAAIGVPGTSPVSSARRGKTSASRRPWKRRSRTWSRTANEPRKSPV